MAKVVARSNLVLSFVLTPLLFHMDIMLSVAVRAIAKRLLTSVCSCTLLWSWTLDTQTPQLHVFSLHLSWSQCDQACCYQLPWSQSFFTFRRSPLGWLASFTADIICSSSSLLEDSKVVSCAYISNYSFWHLRLWHPTPFPRVLFEWYLRRISCTS